MRKFLMTLSIFSLLSVSAWSTEIENTTALTSTATSQSNDGVTALEKLISSLPKISGYLQAGYNYGNEDGDNRSSFRVNRLRMFVDKSINKTFDFKIQLELFSGSTDATAYSKKVMTVMDAFVNIKLDKKFNVRVGQFYTPIGFENYDISPATLETVNFSDICYRIACRNPVSYPDLIDYGRDLGFLLYGDLFDSQDGTFSHLSYNLSVTNGYLPTLMDDNKSKDIVGRLTFRPIQNLRIMGTYAWGESKYDSSELYVPVSRYVLGAWYQAKCGLNLRTEYAGMTATSNDETTVDESAFYFLASWKFNNIIPVVRYEMYRDAISETAATNKDSIVLGATYEFNPSVKLQLNYAHYMYTDEVINAGTKGGDGNGLYIVLLTKF